MTKQLIVSLVITIPDSADPFAEAAHYAHFQPAWATLLEALKTGGADYDIKFKEVQKRAPRKRKPRIAAVPPAGEAA
jgi:hypothetical protein